MPEEAQQPIKVSAYQGASDMLTASLRLLAVILSTAPAAALLVRKGDLIGLYDYFHTQPGVALLGAFGGLGSLAFGIYKAHKRGAQVATVAASDEVPDSVAQIK